MMLWGFPLAVALTIGAGDVPLTINQHDVSRPEFIWFMEQERTGVFEYFKSTCNLEVGKDFWTHDCAGTTPRALLQARTVDRLTREKVEQILFQELGLIEDFRYSNFLENLEKLNRQREEADRKGEVIYGPVRYTQLQFYGHWKATLQLEAKKKLARDKPVATDQELRAFYDTVKEKFRTPTTMSLEIVSLRSSGGLPVEAIQADLDKGQTPQEVAQRFNRSAEVAASTRRFDAIDNDRIGELFQTEEDFAKVAALAPGKCVAIAAASGEVEIVRCLSRNGGEIPTFEAARSRVAARYPDVQYNRLIDRRVKSALVQTNPKVIDALLPSD
jgi:hypothetical protein